MSKLIEMRQRIKTVQTIKKVTHAMRLIAMAHSTAAKNKTANIQAKSTALKTVVTQVQAQVPHADTETAQEPTTKNLIIIIGSQKGLCGNFNTFLIEYFKEHCAKESTIFADADYIVVGKKIIELTQSLIANPLISLAQLSNSNVVSVATQLANIVNEKKKQYASVIALHNYPKSFFMAKPTQTVIYGNAQQSSNTTDAAVAPAQSAYYWYENPQQLLHTLEEASIQTAIQSILLASLSAEHAARFIAMDNATRNAQELMDTMKLDYHKLRQTKITKELTDLIASF